MSTRQHHPSPTELDDLELLLSGAASPVVRFNEPGSPLTLELPDDLADADQVELVDPEGLPLAVVRPGDPDGWPVEALTHAQHGPFRRLYLTPQEVREQHAGHTFVPVVDALTNTQLEDLRGRGPVVLLALAGTGTPELSPVALLRATLVAAASIEGAAVVAVPLASHGDADLDHALGAQVVATYAAGDPVHGLVDRVGGAGDDGDLPDEIADIVRRDRPEPAEQGLVLFFTGLSGSGKSTLAQALTDRILERAERSVTSLDGDVVRRNLSAGLTFSKADRETNIRRIGWVAAEISRHGGIAVCSPIAPFDETRQQVREMVEAAGGAFFLVHVATPLEECERRDRKGLYAKARRGEIPEFTGISSPYEEPEDAAVRVDTTGRTIDDALGDVLVALRDEGYVDLVSTVGSEDRAADVGRGRLSSPATEPARSREGVSKPGDVAADDESAAPLKVLFVCTANICRSPYMELATRRLLGSDTSVVVSSAGTHGFDAAPMSEELIAGYEEDAESFRSRRATRELVEEADVVLTAETTHRAYLLEEAPAAFRKIFTLGQLAQAVQAYADLPGPPHGRELLAELSRHPRAADPSLNIADPYRRGPEASRAAAERIDELLAVVVPALRQTQPTQ
ncbi:adenylyl-sulfate kinase [Nocardioides bigeumensis]|uniref:Adenylyl-sulfate kinase n=1 Tax=Nocardioides bigeumensis TaxID=433657 RepID=A0ABN2YG76_9ACTN